jgi:hypothetical protein
MAIRASSSWRGEDELVEVIPVSEKRLANVTTPFVAFEHPFEDRVGRYEHQIEAATRYMPVILFGDTWPDAYHKPLSYQAKLDFVRGYANSAQRRWATVLWPETILYVTEMAQLLGVNERVRYRPQMWTFCQYFEMCNHQVIDVELLCEGVIHVPNRCVYPLTYPKLRLQKEKCDLTILYWGRMTPENKDNIPTGSEVLMMGDEPDGESFNRGIEQAHGRFVALCREGDRTLVAYRFKRQMDDDADLSLSSVSSDELMPAPDNCGPHLYPSWQSDEPIEVFMQPRTHAWSLRGYTSESDRPTAQLSTMMFKRSLFDRIPGAHPDLIDGFEYDLYVRIVADQQADVTYHRAPLVHHNLELPFGRVYAQQVYNDAVNRVRYEQDYHALSIRRRPLGECVFTGEGSAALVRERARAVAAANQAQGERPTCISDCSS